MIIKVKQDYGIDLADEDLTSRIAKALEDLAEPQLEIDLSGCVLDYPATSTVIDGALRSLSEAGSPRSLTVVFNIAFHERILIKWLFFGGELLDQEKYSFTESNLRKHLNRCFREKGVRFTVEIRDSPKEAVSVSYSYG